MESTSQQQAKAQLREAVESTFGRKMQGHKDFTHLADDVLEKLQQYISPTTLKRFWGYLSEPVEPREETLDILSRYVGFDDWKSFAENAVQEVEIPAAEIASPPPCDEPNNPPKNERQTPRRWPWLVLLLLLLGIASFVVKTIASRNDSAAEKSLDEHYILRKGQVFSSCDEYLRLFGLTDVKDYPYHQVHPHYPFITLWGPHFRHPDWSNEGDSVRMLPTIVERWAPADALPELIEMRNFEYYHARLRLNEVRLTFMKNLTDTNYVFLGAYRMSLAHSDTTQTVWERVADEVDLRHLEYLELLRHP